jgi:hypothetical protein
VQLLISGFDAYGRVPCMYFHAIEFPLFLLDPYTPPGRQCSLVV